MLPCLLSSLHIARLSFFGGLQKEGKTLTTGSSLHAAEATAEVLSCDLNTFVEIPWRVSKALTYKGFYVNILICKCIQVSLYIYIMYICGIYAYRITLINRVMQKSALLNTAINYCCTFGHLRIRF